MLFEDCDLHYKIQQPLCEYANFLNSFNHEICILKTKQFKSIRSMYKRFPSEDAAFLIHVLTSRSYLRMDLSSRMPQLGLDMVQ
jgi:hypothetical protein